MTDCELCGKPFKNGPENPNAHYTCDKIFDERMSNNICTRCGVNPIGNAPLGANWCRGCGLAGKFKGYPGSA